MTYAAAIILPNAVKTTMFGLLKRSDVERAIRAARQDIYADNVADYRKSQAELVEIVKSASRPAGQPQEGSQPADIRPAP